MDRCKPPLRDRSNRTDNGLAVRGEGEGLETGSKVRQPHWTRSKCGREISSSVLNVLILPAEVEEESRSGALRCTL